MGLAKYKGFIPDEELPAENVNSIDPDNIETQTEGQLIGGSSIGITELKSLANGDNNGAFKINIDGTENDNVAVDIYSALSNPANASATETEQLAIGSTASNEKFSYTYVFWQTFTMPANVFIKKIKLYQHENDGSSIKICKANANDTLESTDALATGSYSGAEGEKEITLSSPVYTGKTQRKFAVVVAGQSGSWRYLKTSGSRSYMDGRLWNSSSFKDKDLYLKVYVSDVDNNLFLVDLAGKTQTAVRTKTTKTETVIYNTDHYEIKSVTPGKTSKVLKATAPSAGTNISELLDIGSNATEIAGQGDDFNLIRANGDNVIPRGVLPLRNYSIQDQAIAAATRTYIVGSQLQIPNLLKVGTMLRWKFNITKTAAGTAASTYDICFGLAGSTADTARISFAKPAGTAAADEGIVEIMATIRSIGANGIAIGEFKMAHNLAATGHAVIPNVVVNSISAGFDMTIPKLKVGVCITSGASDAITIKIVQAEILQL